MTGSIQYTSTVKLLVHINNYVTLRISTFKIQIYYIIVSMSHDQNLH